MKNVKFGKERRMSKFQVADSEGTDQVSVTIREISTSKGKHQVLVLSCNNTKCVLNTRPYPLKNPTCENAKSFGRRKLEGKKKYCLGKCLFKVIPEDR